MEGHVDAVEQVPHVAVGLLEFLVPFLKLGIDAEELLVAKGIDALWRRWVITSSPDPNEKVTLVLNDVTDQMSDRFREMPAGVYQERRMLRAMIDTISVGLIVAENNCNIWSSNDLADQLIADHLISTNGLPQ